MTARNSTASAADVLPALSPEDRTRAKHAKAVYELQIAQPELSWRQAERIVNHWEFQKFLRQRYGPHLLPDAAGALLAVAVVAGMWLGGGS